MRWLGPECGVIQSAAGAIANAVWDLFAKTQAKPLWEAMVGLGSSLADMLDLRWVEDALSRDEARSLLSREGTQDKIAELKAHG